MLNYLKTTFIQEKKADIVYACLFHQNINLLKYKIK